MIGSIEWNEPLSRAGAPSERRASCLSPTLAAFTVL